MSTAERVLRVADRCDRCQAQAFVRVEFGSPERVLDFCGHHYALHEPAIVGYPWTTAVVDERRWINTRSTSSA